MKSFIMKKILLVISLVCLGRLASAQEPTIQDSLNHKPTVLRKGSELDTYYLTPKVKEGTVIVRVGYMDFLGAYFKLADLEFTVVSESSKPE